MKGRTLNMRERAVFAPLTLALSLALASAAAHAGILRDVMVSVGLSKPAPPAPGSPGSQTLPRKGFACCVLHYSRDWINDGNYAELPMIPAGTPIEVLSYGSNRAYIKVDGKPMRLGHDYGRDQESFEAWVNKIVVNDDPRARISTLCAAHSSGDPRGQGHGRHDARAGDRFDRLSADQRERFARCADMAHLAIDSRRVRPQFRAPTAGSSPLPATTASRAS